MQAVNRSDSVAYGVALHADISQNRRDVSAGAEIRLRRRRVGFSRQSDLAKAAGVATETVHRIETGKNIETESLDKVVAALEARERELGVSDLSRQPGTGKPVPSELEDFDRDITRGYKKHDVPVIGDAEASSNGFIVWDSEGMVAGQIEEWVSRSFADGDPKAYALRVRGDSMVPRYHAGEIIVAQPRLTCRDGDYAVVILESGERLVKRVFRTSGGWVLHSENTEFPDRTVTPSEVSAMHPVLHSIARR